jgi:hypothetical protein
MWGGDKEEKQQLLADDELLCMKCEDERWSGTAYGEMVRKRG